MKKSLKMDDLVPLQDFNAALWKRFKEGKIRNVYPKAKYDHIIKKIKMMSQNPPVNSPGEYYLLRKFVIAKVGTTERLACKDFNSGAKNGFLDLNNVKFYVALEEIYEFIDKVHRSTKHGGRDRIARVLQEQGVMNIARDTVELFLSFCQVCRPRQKESVRRSTPRLLHRSSLAENSDDSLNMTIEDSVTIETHEDLHEISLKQELSYEDEEIESVQVTPVINFKRGHVAILDLTASPDGEFRFILVYLDYDTEFTILRPIKCKCTYEVASHLLDIFTFISPPQILHSDYDSPFLSTVIHELKQSWPDCVVVFSRENVQKDIAKRCISAVESMLRDWISENSSHRWSYGLKFVQLKRNTETPSSDGKTPYERFFGRVPQTVPSYLTSSLQHEEDLVNEINRHKAKPEQLQVTLDPNICTLVQNNVPNSSVQNAVQLSEDELVIDTVVVKSEPLESEDESSFQ